METKEFLEVLDRDPEETESLENDPTFQFQMETLQAMKSARQEGVPFLALEYRLMDVLYALYNLSAQAGELEDDELLADGEIDEETLLMLDLVGTTRRALHQDLDEDVTQEQLEAAFDVATDEDRIPAFYNL